MTRDEWKNEVGKGWWPILGRMFDAWDRTNADVRILQIKEKFGTLRVYVDVDEKGANKINSIIATAERESGATCEFCGQPGTMRDKSWMKTLCDACFSQWQSDRAAAVTDSRKP